MSAVAMAQPTIFQPPQPSPEELFQSAMDLITNQIGVSNKDLTVPKALLEQAANQSHLRAMVALGRLYQDAIGVSQDLNRAIDLFTQAANAENPAAKFYLARSYWKGIGVPEDHRRARDLLEEAESLGFTKATPLLGAFLQDGIGRPKDLPRAIQLFIKAADAGDLKSKIALVYYYEHGIQVPQDLKKVVQLLEEAAAGGNTEAKEKLGFAYAKLGLAYQQGNENLPQNYILAEKYYKMGEIQRNPVCLRYLGLLYHQHYQNIPTAIGFFQQAIDKGDLRSYAYLGSCYCFGVGVPVDPNHAYSLFLRGKEDGACMYWLGCCAEEGVGENACAEQAQEWFRQSAKEDHPWKQAAQEKLRAAEAPQE